MSGLPINTVLRNNGIGNKPKRRTPWMTWKAHLWTDEEDRWLVWMWNKDFSASAIAERFGFCTRNAVIGRLHRLREKYGKDLDLSGHKHVYRGEPYHKRDA